MTRDTIAREAREDIARIIDPSSWLVLDGYLADVKRKYAGQDAAYDPLAFKDRASLAKADAILTLLSERDTLAGKVGELEGERRAAWNELHCCDDVPLNGDMVTVISALNDVRYAERDRANRAEFLLALMAEANRELARDFDKATALTWGGPSPNPSIWGVEWSEE